MHKLFLSAIRKLAFVHFGNWQFEESSTEHARTMSSGKYRFLLLSTDSLLGIVLLVVTLLHCIQLGQAKCLCTVTKNGEYCGTELNELNSQNDCPKKMFFCADSNRDKEAVILVDCKPGKECDIKSFLSNACLKDIKCECPKALKSGQTYCGTALEGNDCSPNITFSCPYLSVIFHPSPTDACLYGCKDGVCLPAPENTKQ